MEGFQFAAFPSVHMLQIVEGVARMLELTFLQSIPGKPHQENITRIY